MKWKNFAGNTQPPKEKIFVSRSNRTDVYKMNHEQLIILREIVWELNTKAPKTLTTILEKMDITNETLNEVLNQLDKETEKNFVNKTSITISDIQKLLNYGELDTPIGKLELRGKEKGTTIVALRPYNLPLKKTKQ